MVHVNYHTLGIKIIVFVFITGLVIGLLVDYSNEVKIQKTNRNIDSLIQMKEYDEAIIELQRYTQNEKKFIKLKRTK